MVGVPATGYNTHKKAQKKTMDGVIVPWALLVPVRAVWYYYDSA